VKKGPMVKAKKQKKKSKITEEIVVSPEGKKSRRKQLTLLFIYLSAEPGGEEKYEKTHIYEDRRHEKSKV
jgi:hypothetical protein